MDLVVVIDTGFIGAEHEVDVHIPDDHWGEMTPEQRESYMQDAMRDAIEGHISVKWKTAEDHYGNTPG